MAENKIRVLMIDPLLKPHCGFVENDTGIFEKLIKGPIEEMQLDDRTVLVCGRDSKINEEIPNRYVGKDIICGKFFVVGDSGKEKYESLSEKQAAYYYKMFEKAEVISQQEVKEYMALGLCGIGNDTVYLNTLGMRLYENETDFTKVAASYKTHEKQDAKELLKMMYDTFVSTYKTNSVDELLYKDDDFIHIPAVIKSDKTDSLCVGLIFVDLTSSGEQHGVQFAFSGGFYEEHDVKMTDEIMAERKEIGSYNYWFPLSYFSDIHSENDNIPEDVKEMLDYAKGNEEQTQGMDLNI